jgi:protein O-mannosyl-transferase
MGFLPKPGSHALAKKTLNKMHSPSFKPNWHLGYIAFLSLMVLVIYGQTINHDFVNYDDDFYVTENPFIKDGLSWDGIEWAFSIEPKNSQWVPANWIPLTHLSHLISVQLFGLNPAAHHLVNIAFHLFNVLLLFSLLVKTTGNKKASLMAAILFAIHPLHVESVAWISERKDVLSLFFGLLAIHSYLKYVGKKSIFNAFRVCVLFLLGLMAKPMLVTIPFVLLLFDYWPLKRINFYSKASYLLKKNKNLILEKIPFFLITIFSCWVALSFQAKANAINSLQSISFGTRIENVTVSYWVYLQKILWPTGLTVFYPLHLTPYGILEVIFGFILVLSVSIFAVIWRRDKPHFFIGWFWFIGTLIPVIGLIQVGSQAFADRYMYLPAIGLYIALSWEISNYQSLHKSQKEVLSLVFGTTLFLLTLSSFFQVKHWESSVTLFSHTLRHTWENETAHINLGIAYSDPKDEDKKLDHFLKAVKINPKNHRTFYNIGDIFLKNGELEKAIGHYKKALGIQPNFAKAHNNLGIAFSKKGSFNKAAKHFQLALTLDPQMVEAEQNLEITFGKIDKLS